MTSGVQQTTKRLLRERIRFHRTSSILVAIAFVTLIVASIYVFYDGRELAGWEIWVFDVLNDSPDWLEPFFVWMTNIGTIGAVVIAGLIALITQYRRIGLAILFAGGLGWYVSDTLKDITDRMRPDGFIEDAIIRYTSLAEGFGYPSGHSAVGAACAMAIALIVPKKYAIWLILLALSVGISRVYLGVHLPLDVVGGWCIGIIVGYVVDFLLRVERVAIQHEKAEP